MKKIVIVIFLGDSVAGEDHLRRHQPPDRGKQRSIGTRSLLPAPPLRFGRPLPVSHGAEAHRQDYAWLMHTGYAAGRSENCPSTARLFEFQAEQCAQRSEGIVSFEMGVGQIKIAKGPGNAYA